MVLTAAPFDPAAALVRYHAAIDRLDFAAIEAMLAADAAYVSAGIGAIRGREAIMAAFRSYFADYGDQVSTDEAAKALSPRAAWSRWRLRATNAATGKVSNRTGEEIVTFDDEGLIVRVDVTDDAAANP